MSGILPEKMAKNPRWKRTGSKEGRAGTYVRDQTGSIRSAWVTGKSIANAEIRRVNEAGERRWCSGCGTGFSPGETVVFATQKNDLDGGFEMDNFEPPMHLACAGYAARACPHIRRNKLPMILATKWTSETMVHRGMFKWRFDVEDDVKASHEEFLEMTRPSRPERTDVARKSPTPVET